MARLFVAITPIAGAILVPLLVTISISKLGISFGVISALFFSTIWFVAMLLTSEMPH